MSNTHWVYNYWAGPKTKSSIDFKRIKNQRCSLSADFALNWCSRGFSNLFPSQANSEQNVEQHAVQPYEIQLTIILYVVSIHMQCSQSKRCWMKRIWTEIFAYMEKKNTQRRISIYWVWIGVLCALQTFATFISHRILPFSEIPLHTHTQRHQSLVVVVFVFFCKFYT